MTERIANDRKIEGDCPNQYFYSICGHKIAILCQPKNQGGDVYASSRRQSERTVSRRSVTDEKGNLYRKDIHKMMQLIF